MVDPYYPVVDDNAGADPAEAVIEEEDEGPLALPVKELLGPHLGVEVALEEEKVVHQRDVDDVCAVSSIADKELG